MSGTRVALVVPSLRGGGLERVVRDLALRIRRHGFEPGVFGMTGLGVYEHDLRAEGVALFDARQQGPRVPGYPRTLIRQLRGFRPALIHAHSGTWLPSVVAGMFLSGVSVIFTDHGRYPPEPRGRAWIERWCLGRTARLVAVSGSLAEYLARFLGRRARAEVIPNGIDLAKFHSGNVLRREALRKQWEIGPSHVLGIAVGRLAPVKNHLGMIRALAEAGAAAAEVRLAFVGSGPLEEELRNEARARGVDSRIRFLGFRDDVSDCLAASDFWLSASTTEGLPLSLLEAMAAGLPVIATAVGGIPETLASAGIVVPPGDESSMAAAMEQVGRDPGYRRRLGEAARARSTAYSVDAMTERYAGLYRETLEGRLAQ